MIDVEVRGQFGQFLKATLKNVVGEDAFVLYYSKQDIPLISEERIPISHVRIPPNTSRHIQAGETAEVLFTLADSQIGMANEAGTDVAIANSHSNIPPLSADTYPYLDSPAWWPCKVQRIRDEVAVVKFQVIPPSDASPSMVAHCTQLSTVTDIVNRSTLRPMNTDFRPLDSASIHRHIIEIPKELADFAADPAVHSDFLKHCGGPTSVYFDADACALVVLGTDADTIRNLSLLEETHLKMLRQKWAITRSLRQTIRNLEVTRGSHGNFPTSRNATSDFTYDPSMHYEKFYVPQRLMGLAIGAHGANIRAARDISDVQSIRLLEPGAPDRLTESVNTDYAGDCADATLVVVEAQTAEAAKQARTHLEYTELYLGVPRRYVGRLIGRKTANILSVIEKSGVVQIHFDDHIHGPSDDEPVLNNMENLNLNTSTTNPSNSGLSAYKPHMRRIFLRTGGTTNSTPYAQSDEEYGGFVLSGTREAVDKARLLISFQLDYIFDLEKMEAERVALMRNLSYNGPDSSGTYGNRGYNDSSMYVTNRGGGGGRGGRRPPPRGQQYPRDDAVEEISFRGGVRRPLRNQRNYDNNRRARRPGGRMGGQGGGAMRRDYQFNRTGDNGDVVDRRRPGGSEEDSDGFGTQSSHDMESDEHEMTGRYRSTWAADKRRETNPTDEANYPSGDGEMGIPRAIGLNRRNRPSSMRDGSGSSRASRNNRPPRSRPVVEQQNGRSDGNHTS